MPVPARLLRREVLPSLGSFVALVLVAALVFRAAQVVAAQPAVSAKLTQNKNKREQNNDYVF